MKQEIGQRVLAMLQEVREYLDSYIDVVDGDEGEVCPNRAMVLCGEIDEILALALALAKKEE